MARARDMTQAQFDKACKKHGFKSQGVMGYYSLGPTVPNGSASVFNAGSRRRDQLAYLIQSRDKFLKRYRTKELLEV